MKMKNEKKIDWLGEPNWKAEDLDWLLQRRGVSLATYILGWGGGGTD